MAGGTPALRLLPLLLLLLLPGGPLREYLLTASNDDSGGRLPSAAAKTKDDNNELRLHPIVLLAGLGCSDIEARLTEAYRPSTPRCGAMKGKGWFPLWHNASDLEARDYVACFLEQMRLVYDPAANEYRNLAGVETRVPRFGSPSAFHDKNPLHPKRCLDNVREALEAVGYRENDTMFGAPYDWRHAPPVPGQPSRVYSRYFGRFRTLVEAASEKHNDKKVIIFAHSYGGMVALEFVRNMPPAWRDRYVKRLILSAPTLSAGFVSTVQGLVSGSGRIIYVPATDADLLTLWRSFETAVVDLPSPRVFGRDPIVVTNRRNFSAYDTEELLAAVGFEEGVEPFRRRAAPKADVLEPPMVPLTCMNGVGNRTPRRLVFWDGDFDSAEPDEIAYGDGDGSVNLESMDAFDEEMRRHPRQRTRFRSVRIDGVQHSELVTDDGAIERVIQEIIEANK